MGFRLLKRVKNFYVRIWVPLDVRSIFKRTELKKSLRTGSRSDARVLASGLLHKAETIFMRIRSGMLTDRQLEALAANLIEEFTGRIAQHKAEQGDAIDWLCSDAGLFPSTDIDIIDKTLKRPRTSADVTDVATWYTRRIVDLENEIATECFSRETRLNARRIIQDKQLDVELPHADWFSEPGRTTPALSQVFDDNPKMFEHTPANDTAAWNVPAPPSFNIVCLTLVQAQIEAFRHEAERAQGKLGTSFQHVIADRIEAAQPKPKLSDLWLAYHKYKMVKGRWNEKSESNNLRFYKEAVRMLGDKELGAYTQDDVIDFIKRLKKKGNTSQTCTGIRLSSRSSSSSRE